MDTYSAITAILGAPQNDLQATIYYFIAGIAALLLLFLPVLIIRNIFRS